jgi:hypothetical protein
MAEIWVFSLCRNMESSKVCQVVLRGLLVESMEEQNSAQRRGKWLLPGGRTVRKRAPVHYDGESGAITFNCK